jgi:hypothetical protein
VIGNGTPEMARNFRAMFDFHGTAAATRFSSHIFPQGRIYLDQQRVLYSAFGCRRGYRFALSPSAMLRAKEAFGMGLSQVPKLLYLLYRLCLLVRF